MYELDTTVELYILSCVYDMMVRTTPMFLLHMKMYLKLL